MVDLPFVRPTKDTAFRIRWGEIPFAYVPCCIAALVSSVPAVVAVGWDCRASELYVGDSLRSGEVFLGCSIEIAEVSIGVASSVHMDVSELGIVRLPVRVPVPERLIAANEADSE